MVTVTNPSAAGALTIDNNAEPPTTCNVAHGGALIMEKRKGSLPPVTKAFNSAINPSP